MATKKPTGGKTPATGKAMTNWEERLAQEAEVATKMEEHVGAGGNSIKTAGGRFSYGGGTTDKLEVIVLDHILENAFYAGRFDPDNPAPPSCFALGRDEDTMVPHENVVEPINETCKGCPNNEFESADTGRGKACKNVRRLMLLNVDDAETAEKIESAETASLKIPVTSVKNWAIYLRKLKDSYARPPLGVLTEITLTPDPKSQWKMNFRMMEVIEDGSLLEALFAKKDDIQSALTAPYTPAEEREERSAKPSKAHGKVPAKSSGGRAATGRGRR